MSNAIFMIYCKNSKTINGAILPITVSTTFRILLQFDCLLGVNRANLWRYKPSDIKYGRKKGIKAAKTRARLAEDKFERIGAIIRKLKFRNTPRKVDAAKRNAKATKIIIKPKRQTSKAFSVAQLLLVKNLNN